MKKMAQYHDKMMTVDIMPLFFDTKNESIQDKVSIKNVTTRTEQIYDQYMFDMKVQFFFEFIQVVVYTYLFYHMMEKNSGRLQRQMKVMLITFEVLLIVSLLVSGLVAFYLDNTMTKYERWNVHLGYGQFNRSVFLILFFKVLFAFKKVELQINPEYDSLPQIIGILRKQVLIERFFLGVYALLIVSSLYVIVLLHRVSLMKHRHIWVFYVIDSLLVAGVGFYLLCYFYRMASFFIRLLEQNNQINASWNRAYILSILLVISIYLFRDYLLIQSTLTITRIFTVVTFDRASVAYISFQRVLNYIKQTVPFAIATFIINIVEYFARSSGGNGVDEEESCYEEPWRQNLDNLFQANDNEREQQM